MCFVLFSFCVTAASRAVMRIWSQDLIPHTPIGPFGPIHPFVLLPIVLLACFIKFHESPAALSHILCMLLMALPTKCYGVLCFGVRGALVVPSWGISSLPIVVCSNITLGSVSSVPKAECWKLKAGARIPYSVFRILTILYSGPPPPSTHALGVVSTKATKTVGAFIYLLLISTVPGRNLFAINFITIIHVRTNK